MNRLWSALLFVGSGSIIAIALSAVRSKMVALELGANGIGELGILLTAISTTAVAFSLGISSSGTRSIAMVNLERPANLVVHAAATLWGSHLLACVSGPVCAYFWLTHGDALVDSGDSRMLAPWVGIAVAATVGTAGITGLLNGMGRFRELAMMSAGGALIGTAATVPMLLWSKDLGLVSAFSAAPLGTWAIGVFWIRGYIRPALRVSIRQWIVQCRRMIPLGATVSLSLLVASAGQLGSRILVKDGWGAAGAGYFQAGMAIAGMYLGFVLAALATEYFPRLSAVPAADLDQFNKTASRQTELVILLGVPVIGGLILVAPAVLQVLYTEDFVQASLFLRAVLVGDIFKLVGWALGYALMAREENFSFLLAEVTWTALFLVLLWAFRDHNLALLGLGYILAYVIYCLIVVVFTFRATRLRLPGRLYWMVLFSCVGCTSMLFLVEASEFGGFPLAVGIELVLIAIAVRLAPRLVRQVAS